MSKAQTSMRYFLQFGAFHITLLLPVTATPRTHTHTTSLCTHCEQKHSPLLFGPSLPPGTD